MFSMVKKSRNSAPPDRMDSVEISTHFAAGESQTREFKTSFDKACLASLVAFANTQGGTVWVGVTDKGVVQGVTLGKETLNEWLGQIKSATSPSLIPELTRHTIEGKTVVAIEIAEFPVKPVNTRGRYYKRIASAKTENELEEIKVELIDRFGLLPDPARTLLDIARLRQQAQKLGIRKLEGNEKGGVIEFAEKNHVNPAWLIGLLQKQPQHYRLDGPTRLKFIQDLSERKTRIEWVRQFMRELEENAIA